MDVNHKKYLCSMAQNNPQSGWGRSFMKRGKGERGEELFVDCNPGAMRNLLYKGRAVSFPKRLALFKGSGDEK